MKILAIETSCDETAIAILDARGKLDSATGPRFFVCGNALISQIDIHKEFGGVFPALAKREHAKNLVPLLRKALKEARMLGSRNRTRRDMYTVFSKQLMEILEREPLLLEQVLEVLPTIKKPPIDALAVTYGPGLAPALWVGINFARALALVWNLPIIPVNHMHGHIAAGLFKISATWRVMRQQKTSHNHIEFPLLALLISGGHTELVLMKDFKTFKVIGETRDDAAGEAFDKVARMLGLPYPGGPQISALAREARERKIPTEKYLAAPLPRPMIKSNDLDFSFSGLKTAVLYALRAIEKQTRAHTLAFARELEDAIADVLCAKVKKALEVSHARTFVLGGGVSANTHIRSTLVKLIADTYPETEIRVPPPELATDNAIMIGMAAYVVLANNINLLTQKPDIAADGNARLGD
ncbi:MAG: O-sialoglycoprotein endopeptidase [Parcubacteria group bacterium Gr01-1014_48]|nr:MAG: O-sialoglycoprotein endopeptidase [Parcubacteria group bacterium Greene0416_14]TSC71571.1 MAG: O-sialoglycoprotein endopeptidase [Parcubacteria group bacterium Gr01-1014_48]TSC99798.1 MAG: O-sialoglycoprotein endopeptidase [Parcubacteria group bacterium Greene1014_15]TSD07837.1 MAG: O-sialoglycoprotein endopeptidase [Parcubacteria group bacterium Greene0714_4]